VGTQIWPEPDSVVLNDFLVVVVTALVTDLVVAVVAVVAPALEVEGAAADSVVLSDPLVVVVMNLVVVVVVVPALEEDAVVGALGIQEPTML